MFEEIDLSHKFRKLKRENKKLTDEIEKLKAYLARTKEDHQYDNLVHKKELESLNKTHGEKKSELMGWLYNRHYKGKK